MKLFWSSLMVVLLAAFGTVGCSKKVQIDTTNLEYSLQTADESTQTAVTEALEQLDKAEYDAALAKLKTVSADPKLTAEQKTAVNGVIEQIEKR